MAAAIVRVADLRQQVYEHLKEQIKNSAYPSNAKFQEISLAEQLGVSRTPVREALAMLVRDGMLVPMTRGFKLPQFSAEEIAEIIEIRLLIEPYAISKLVELTDRERLRALASDIEKELEKVGNSDKYLKALSKIRALIFSCVPNKELVQAIARYEDAIHYLRMKTLMKPEVREISIALMRQLVSAFKENNPKAAKEANRQQLLQAQAAYLAALEAEAEKKPVKRRAGQRR